jgi:hypothetical protein
MSSLKMIEKVFKTTLPKSFTKVWEGLPADKTCILKVYNHEEFYVLNEAAIATLNTKNDKGITLDSEIKKVHKLISERPHMHDYVPIAVDSLYSYFYCFIAFKKNNGVIEDESLYSVLSFTDSSPEEFKVRKIASKYTDIFGDERYAESTGIFHGKGEQFTIRAAEQIYSHLFERYAFMDSYLDFIAQGLNQLFSIFEDVKIFDEGGHTIYCESGGVRSVVFDSGDKVMIPIENVSIGEPEMVIYNNLKNILGDKLGPYTLYIFHWRFSNEDVAPTGLGLSRNNNLDPLIDQYGMTLSRF